MVVLWNKWTPTSEAVSHLQKMTSVCDQQRHGQLLIGYQSYGSPTYPIEWNAIFSKVMFIPTWMLTKCVKKNKLDSNCTRMLQAILNKSWKQHPTKQQLYGHLHLISKTIWIRWTRHVGHCWRNKDELISDVLLWTPFLGRVSVRQPARTYLQQLCTDTGCSLEDQWETMDNREGLWEKVREVCSNSSTWWWWLIAYQFLWVI